MSLKGKKGEDPLFADWLRNTEHPRLRDYTVVVTRSLTRRFFAPSDCEAESIAVDEIDDRDLEEKATIKGSLPVTWGTATTLGWITCKEAELAYLKERIAELNDKDSE